MRQASVIITILIITITYAVQDNTTQVINPQFNGIDLSIPMSINFQGYLYRDGTPMDTTMNIWFGIYTALSGGSLLFQQTINNVEVVNGWFTITLDNIPNSVFPVSGPTRYLEVKAPSTGPALEPRISLVSVGYSYHSITADTAEYANAGIPTGSAGGDLIGVYPNPTVDGLWGRSIASTAPGTNQVLKWTGSQWAPGNDSVGSGGSGTITSVSHSTGITCTPNPITTTGTVALNTGYTDGRYVDTSGDSMTGDLAMSSNLRVYNKALIGTNCSNSGSNAFAVGNGSAVSGNRSSILGGYQNTIDGNDATIAGGAYNYAATHVCFIGAGQSDTVYGRFSGVLSGYGNRAGNATSDTAATVAGGYNNSANEKYSFVGGGKNNQVFDWYATIAGGRENTADGPYSSVGGGRTNYVYGSYATISGGLGNSAGGNYSTVCGGGESFVNAFGATAVGYRDTARSYYSFAVGYRSVVPTDCEHSAACNGQTATGSSQLRCDDLYANSMIFGMDHPLDLDNKILNQFAVGSPEILLTFRGACVIGTDGKVRVNLPDYFDALCRNPMVQLTGVGTSDIFVAEDVQENSFTVGGKPETKVYWVVTGERKDQLAEVTRTLTPVEKTRTDELIGRSINEASLANKMAALEQKGLGSKFYFRTAAGKSRYESSRKLLEAKP